MRVKLTATVLLLIALCGCNRISSPLEPTAPRQVTLTIVADGESRSLTTSAAIVSEALAEAQIHLGALDGVEPGEYLAVEEGMVITVVRVIEQFHTVEMELLYGQQIVRNEGLPEGERRLLQAGRPGLEEIVYRIEYHDGVEVDRRMVRRTVVEPAVDEILMIGSRGTISPVPIQGTLAYISGGNAVVMRVSSTNRDPIVGSGDLDGRVFFLSPDGQRLLYTRSIPLTDTLTDTVPAFNSLWIVDTSRLEGPIEAESLGVESLLWANWAPDGEKIAYSTAEPIDRPPGWEANNDLWVGYWDESGRFRSYQLLESSSGGIYGWWGANYAWSPDSQYLAYGQADEVGIIDAFTGDRFPLAEFSVFHTYADWVWTPIPTWSPESRFLAAVVHGPPVGPEAAEDSQIFDLWAWEIEGAVQAPLAARVGMWGMPAWSPAREVGNEQFSQIAFLRATKPLESAMVRYSLWVMDRDGSEARPLFPPSGETELRPQPVAWSPAGDQVALINQGDLYLVNVTDGGARPLTGDGINSNPTWAAKAPESEAVEEIEAPEEVEGEVETETEAEPTPEVTGEPEE
jgi:Tol biopolymer transport system component